MKWVLLKQPRELLINYDETKVDEDWLHLILEAKQLGLTIDESFTPIKYCAVVN